MKGKLSFLMSNLSKNVKYLLTHNLYNGDSNQMVQMLDIINWNMSDKYKCPLNVLSQEETLDLLAKSPKSFCRFGDGEVDILEGRDIPFQEYSPRLAEYFLKILGEKHTDLYVGINYYYYHDFDLFNSYTSDFYKVYSYKYGKYFMERCNADNVYIDGGFNQIYQSYSEYDFDGYYDKVRNLFKDKKVVVFSGSGVLEKLQYNVFDRASELLHEKGPSRNAFSVYSELLERALRYDKDYLLCFILGPASKALVYELSGRGYCAWDIGHLAKDYNSYMMREERTTQNMQRFYAPD